MTENLIYFTVKSDKYPEETDALYEITPIQHDLLWMSGPSVRSYQGHTYFKQLECLLDLIKQYGNDIVFFGFTGFATEFKDYLEMINTGE